EGVAGVAFEGDEQHADLPGVEGVETGRGRSRGLPQRRQPRARVLLGRGGGENRDMQMPAVSVDPGVRPPLPGPPVSRRVGGEDPALVDHVLDPRVPLGAQMLGQPHQLGAGLVVDTVDVLVDVERVHIAPRPRVVVRGAGGVGGVADPTVRGAVPAGETRVDLVAESDEGGGEDGHEGQGTSGQGPVLDTAQVLMMKFRARYGGLADSVSPTRAIVFWMPLVESATSGETAWVVRVFDDHVGPVPERRFMRAKSPPAGHGSAAPAPEWPRPCRWSIDPPVSPSWEPVPVLALPSGNRPRRSGRLKVVEPSPAP